MSHEMMDLRQAARHLHIDENELRHFAQREEVPSVKRGETFFFEHRLLDEWAATGITISESSMSFTLADGVLRSDDVEFRGGFLTITGKGTYDLVKDNMDFAVRVKIVKDDSLMGMLKNPLLWPFSKLSTVLFGFRASGSLKNPSWNYDTAILERFR